MLLSSGFCTQTTHSWHWRTTITLCMMANTAEIYRKVGRQPCSPTELQIRKPLRQQQSGVLAPLHIIIQNFHRNLTEVHSPTSTPPKKAHLPHPHLPPKRPSPQSHFRILFCLFMGFCFVFEMGSHCGILAGLQLPRLASNSQKCTQLCWDQRLEPSPPVLQIPL